MPDRGDPGRRRERPGVRGRRASWRASRCRCAARRRKPGPAVYYKGAHQATLDPLAARRPDGGLFAWATQGAPGPRLVVSGHPGLPSSSAAALLSYDVPHHAPWGWRVSLYTWTKSLAAGGFAVPLLLALTGYLRWGDPVARWAAPSLALGFLAVTGALLIWDLKHPLRFYLIFTRHQWRSWLVRGSFIIGGYGGVAALYLLAAIGGWTGARQVLAAIGVPLALAHRLLHRATCSPRRRRATCGRARCWPRTWPCRRCWPARPRSLPFAVWLSPGRAVTAAEVVLARRRGHAPRCWWRAR